MRLTWFGTASIALTAGDSRLLFDPFVPLKASRVNTRYRDFDGYKHVLVTHGHFDHIYDIPHIYRRNPDLHVYCTRTPANTLCSLGLMHEDITLIKPGDRFTIGDFEIEVFHSRHAELDMATALLKPEMLRYAYNLPYLLKIHQQCRENDEIVAYLITAQDKRVLLLGSMNLRKGVEYPKGVDVLILPYIGYKDNLAHGIDIIDRIRPKRVILDHCDDTFPPLTEEIRTSGIIRRCHGWIPVQKPPYRKAIKI